MIDQGVEGLDFDQSVDLGLLDVADCKRLIGFRRHRKTSSAVTELDNGHTQEFAERIHRTRGLCLIPYIKVCEASASTPVHMQISYKFSAHVHSAPPFFDGGTIGACPFTKQT